MARPIVLNKTQSHYSQILTLGQKVERYQPELAAYFSIVLLLLLFLLLLLLLCFYIMRYYSVTHDCILLRRIINVSCIVLSELNDAQCSSPFKLFKTLIR